MMVRVAYTEPSLGRELVYATAANRGTSLTSKHKTMANFFIDFNVIPWMIIDSNNIISVNEAICKRSLDIIKATSHWSGRVLAMAYILKEFSGLPAIIFKLRRHFIANAPHHYRRIVAELMQHIHHVLLGPLVEETMIAVLAFGHIPFVKGLNHHHHSHLVAKTDKLRGRHIVGSSDGITTHIL